MGVGWGQGVGQRLETSGGILESTFQMEGNPQLLFSPLQIYTYLAINAGSETVGWLCLISQFQPRSFDLSLMFSLGKSDV